MNKWPIQPEHLIATFIHPRLRDFSGDQSLKTEALELLRSAVSTYNGTPSGNSSTSDNSSLSNADQSSRFSTTNILSQCYDKPRLQAVKPAIDEVMVWLQSDYDADIIDDDLLSFWRRKKNDFPTIAAIARRVLAIPAANTSVERLFSSSKIIIGDRRTRLGAEKIDKLMFLQKNLMALKNMFDAKNGSATINSKRKSRDESEVEDDSRLLKRIRGDEDEEYELSSDEYESENDNQEEEF